MSLTTSYLILVSFTVFTLTTLPGRAQDPEYDLLIRGGHVIDPRNDRDAVMDVAVSDGKIARVAPEISPTSARQVVEAGGLYVTPGIIDIHAHVYHGTDAQAGLGGGFSSLPPDGFTFRIGVTTVVDVGGAGWRTFHDFKRDVIDRARTRVLAFLNIVGYGMRGNPIEQDLSDMDPKLTAMRIAQFPEILVGVKLAHYVGHEWEPVIRAVEAGRQAEVPVMIDFGRASPELPLDELFLKHLRAGDIYTHAYAHVSDRFPIVDAQGRVEPFAFEAQKRGILFDVGHGGGSFLFRQAVPAIRQGFVADTISTDLHTGSMNAGMKDMLNIMSKFLNMGLTLQDVIFRSTWNPAQAIRRPDLGHLGEGAAADLAVFSLEEGNFGFVDVRGGRLPGDRKLTCELTVRAGRIVYDLNGISRTHWEEMGNR